MERLNIQKQNSKSFRFRVIRTIIPKVPSLEIGYVPQRDKMKTINFLFLIISKILIVLSLIYFTRRLLDNISGLTNYYRQITIIIQSRKLNNLKPSLSEYRSLEATQFGAPSRDLYPSDHPNRRAYQSELAEPPLLFKLRRNNFSEFTCEAAFREASNAFLYSDSVSDRHRSILLWCSLATRMASFNSTMVCGSFFEAHPLLGQPPPLFCCCQPPK